jgi:xanthine dehydrogenase accessory factor
MDIYAETLAFLHKHDRVVLATIISSSGSTPVTSGAKLLLGEDKAIPIGTVGGGCIEADVIETARSALRGDGKCLIRRFVLTEDNIESSMLCGGSMDVLVELLSKEQSALYSDLLSRREAGQDCAIVTLIGPGPGVTGKSLVSVHAAGVDQEDLAALFRLTGEIPASFEETLRKAVRQQAVTRLPSTGGEFIIEPVVGFQDLVIFGGGHVSRYVSRSAAMAGFRVTVIDERPEYANPGRFPEAFRTLAVGFEASWSQMKVRSSTSIVIVTRGHKFDAQVLEQAVKTPARYIGMIGSKQKVLTTFSNLVNRGIPKERLRNVRAPIGLSIGAATAEEIGISITAELIAVRRGVPIPIGAMSDPLAEFFHAQ